MAIIDRRGATVTMADPPSATTPSSDLAIKTPCRAVTTGNIALAGLQTVDGVALNAGDRVLVWQQTDQTQNGIYAVQSGNWQRTIDANNNSQWAAGTETIVTSGILYANQIFACNAAEPIVLGTTNLTFFRPTQLGSTVTVAQGGTGVTSLTAHGVLIGNGTAALNVTTAGTAGYALMGNGASADPTFQGFLQVGAGALTRTWQAKAQEIVSITDYGALANGSDCQAALAAAQTALGAGGGRIWVPPGTWTFASGLAFSKTIWLQGAGRGVTSLSLNFATGDFITFSAAECELTDLDITSSVTKTSGSFVKVDSIRGGIERVRMVGPYRGITFTQNATLSWCRSIDFRNVTPHVTAPDSAGIFMGGSGTGPESVVIDDITFDVDSVVNLPRSCIRMQGGDAAIISNSDLIHGQVNILIDPPTGQGVLSTKLANSFLDSSSVAGLYASPSGTGNVARIWCDNVWFGDSAGHGVQLDTSGAGGATTGFYATNCQFVVNGGSGLLVNNAAWSDIQVIGGVAAQNLNGFDVVAGVNDVTIMGVAIGAFNGLTGNTTGLLLGGGASNRYMIVGNNFNGSATPITISVPFSGTGITIDKNIGDTNYYPSLTNHGILLGQGNVTPVATAAMTNGQLLVGQSGADPLPKSVSGDAALSAAGALTVSKIGGQAVALGGALTFSGAFATTITVTGATTVTLPTTGTLAALGGNNVWSGTNQFGLVGIGAASNANIGLTIGGTLSGQAGEFGLYQGGLTLTPTTGGNAYFQYAGGGTVDTGASATIAAAYGALMPPITKAGSGTITNCYGIFADTQTAGGTNWSIWSAGAASFNGTVFVTGVGTTASAANAFINNASSPANQLLRSTSSLRYKRDIEPVGDEFADKVLQLKPIWYRSKAPADNPAWSWYGFGAEDVAAIEPRLVHWGYADEDWDEVIEQVEIAIEGEEPRTLSHKRRTLKAGAELKPDGVMYDRVVPLLVNVIQRQNRRIEALEATRALH